MSAGVAEAAAPYISKGLYGKDKGSDLTAEEKETVTAITSLLGTATGAVIGDTTANAAQGSLNAQSTVENNFLYLQTAKNKHWLSQEEINVLNTLAKQAGARSLEYFIGEEQKIRQSSLNNIEKEAALIRLKRAYESDSHKMEIAVSKLPRGSKERGILFNIASKMQGVLFAIPPYEKSEFIRAEQRDWLPTSNFIHTGNGGFVAVQKQWVINDGGTLEDAQFQTSMLIGGRAGGYSRESVQAINNTAGVIRDEIRQTYITYNPMIKQIPVTTWAPSGVKPNFNSTVENPRWIQIGYPTQWNFFKTGLPGGKADSFQIRPPFVKGYRPSNVPFGNYKMDMIDKSRLQRPPRWQKIKLGQRLIKPNNGIGDEK